MREVHLKYLKTLKHTSSPLSFKSRQNIRPCKKIMLIFTHTGIWIIIIIYLFMNYEHLWLISIVFLLLERI